MTYMFTGRTSLVKAARRKYNNFSVFWCYKMFNKNINRIME